MGQGEKTQGAKGKCAKDRPHLGRGPGHQTRTLAEPRSHCAGSISSDDLGNQQYFRLLQGLLRPGPKALSLQPEPGDRAGRGRVEVQGALKLRPQPA